ncbi:MAG TPA: MFS transporter [Conexibacter sp.]|jgi:EmrB/QacA subfamily drug resistance transporter|nr:MFS transporter [Conexibacter sp.]
MRDATPERGAGSKRLVLVVLAASQFLMVLDAAVMNVSISQLVADFDTTVTTIQGVITLYALVMAALFMTGGKLGDILGRRRTFVIGHVIYGGGSLLTALSWSVASLTIGWSILEGIGAAMVLPALAALVAGNFEGKARAAAYGALGGVAGAAIAVGPILGGWLTTELTWRLVFAGEVVIALGIVLATPRLVRDAPREGPAPSLDWVGSLLSALGLGLLVFGVLQASRWGWLAPRDSPLKPFGFSLAPFVVAAGGLLLAAFHAWERRQEEGRHSPLVHFALLARPVLRSGLVTFLGQNIVLMGVFFAIPLYLQIVQGLDALQTGVRMLPTSVALLVTALLGARLATRFSPRTLVRVGFLFLLAAVAFLLGTIQPQIDTADFNVAMTVLGVGMGLVVSQLGNVVQSAVEESDRSEAGGLQYTAQQLGSSLGTALIGAIVITGLATAFSANVSNDPRISQAVQSQVSVRLEGDLSFVDAASVRRGAEAAGVSPSETAAIVEGYSDAQLQALKLGLLACGFVVLISLLATRNLPRQRLGEQEETSGDPSPLPEPPPASAS